MTNLVNEAKARVRAALDRWHEARGAVNDPTSVPIRLDQIVSVVERTVRSVDQDVVTEVEALLIELSALRFPVDSDEALGFLENATLSLDGALNRLSRAASRAGFVAADDDLGLPPGVRVPAVEIATQLEAFVAAIEEVKPVLGSIERAQASDGSSNAKQAALVRNIIERALTKIDIIEVKTGRNAMIDVSGIAGIAQQLSAILRSFVATVKEASDYVSRWLSRDVEAWVTPVVAGVTSRVSRLVARTAKWVREHSGQRIGESAEVVPQESTASQEYAFDLLEVERLLDEGKVPPAEVIPYVTSLEDRYYESKSLYALGHMRHLRKLSLSLEGTVDMSPLGNLTALQSLSIFGGGSGDISVLSQLTRLQSLTFGGSRLDDLSAIGELSNLNSLTVYASRVTNISPLSNLKNLRYLNFNDSLVEDISPVAGLALLEGLTFSESKITDLSPLKELKLLKTLDLDETKVSDLWPIAGLRELESLECTDTNVADLRPIVGLTKMKSLVLDGTKIEDIGPIAGLVNLESLDIDRTSVRDLSPLRGLGSLKRLAIRATKVSDLSALALVPALESVDLVGTSVRDLSALRDLPRLRRLSLSAEGYDRLIDAFQRPVEIENKYGGVVIVSVK